MIGGAVLLGTAWWAVSDQKQKRRITELEAERVELLRVIDRLKAERRVARLLVVEQVMAADGKPESTTVDFVALGPQGQPGRIRRVTLPGDVCYIDALTIRFSSDYVEKGDALRGHTLHLFRRMFAEGQRPIDGFALEEPGTVPESYRLDENVRVFEQKLWRRFWEYASEPKVAAEAGVRVAQGEAVYQKLRKGQLWQVATRADGGLEMSPVAVDPVIANHLRGDAAN